jgi:hypothetical protein
MVGEGGNSLAATLEPCCRYLQVAIPDPADRIITQGRALVRAIEALGTIEPSGVPALPFAFLPDLSYTMCM